MTGQELEHFRTRYGLTRTFLARHMKQYDQMVIYHWEKGYRPIPKKHQLKLGKLFAVLETHLPPTQCCPFCNGVGLIHPPREDTMAKDARCESESHNLWFAHYKFTAIGGRMVYVVCSCGKPRSVAVETWEQELARRDAAAASSTAPAQ